MVVLLVALPLVVAHMRVQDEWAWTTGVASALGLSGGTAAPTKAAKAAEKGKQKLPSEEKQQLAQCGFASHRGANALKKSELLDDSAELWKKYKKLHAEERAKGCKGRYLAWDNDLGAGAGLGENMRALAVFLQYAIASKRALIIGHWKLHLDADGHEAGMPYYPTALEPAHIDWSMPSGCDWTDKELVRAPYRQGWFGPSSTTAFKEGMHMFMSRLPQVLSVSGNVAPGQYGRPTDHDLASFDSAPALRSVVAIMQQPIACAFSFLFIPSPAAVILYKDTKKKLEGGYDRKLPVVSVSWNSGNHMADQKKAREQSTWSSMWSRAMSIGRGSDDTGMKPALKFLASCRWEKAHIDDGILYCEKDPHFTSRIRFFSDSTPIRSAAAEEGLAITGFRTLEKLNKKAWRVVPDAAGLTETSSDQSLPEEAAEIMVQEVVELLLMSDAEILVRGPVQHMSAFSLIASELARTKHKVTEFDVDVIGSELHACQADIEKGLELKSAPQQIDVPNACRHYVDGSWYKLGVAKLSR